jgi:hypothetical protein
VIIHIDCSDEVHLFAVDVEVFDKEVKGFV